jgi:RNA polymerase sigma factor (sigma-70 family)
MKDNEHDLSRSMEEPPPDYQEALIKQLHRSGIRRMNCVGCPFAKLCGMELAQDTYIEIAQSDLTKVRNLKAWTYAIIKNRSLNKKRDCRCSSAVEFLEAGDVDEIDYDEASHISIIPLSKYPSPARNPAQTYEHILMLKAARLQLDDEDKQLFVLMYEEEIAPKVAAQILGITHEALRQRIHRLKTKLRGLLI